MWNYANDMSNFSEGYTIWWKISTSLFLEKYHLTKQWYTTENEKILFILNCAMPRRKLWGEGLFKLDDRSFSFLLWWKSNHNKSRLRDANTNSMRKYETLENHKEAIQIDDWYFTLLLWWKSNPNKCGRAQEICRGTGRKSWKGEEKSTVQV